MRKEYISDRISITEIEKWEKGDIIVITAPTGSGKSTFIMDKLYNNANKNDKTILLLSNRDILKEQFNRELGTRENKETIEVVNYQKIENKILHKKEMEEFYKYDYIVCDEAHYFFADSDFNNTTDLSLDWILNQTDKIRIFMSATADFIKRYIEGHKKLKIIPYTLENDYSYIENLYFYEDDDVLRKMLYEIPEGEKVIYFAGAKKAYSMSKELDNSSFLCSEYNTKGYEKYINEKTRQQIIEIDSFDCRFLCTTTAMDNGINIKDESVKHIVIDIFDPDIIEQCLGRRRILNIGETINVYIKNYSGRSLSGKIRGITNKTKYAKFLLKEGQEKLVENYPRQNYGKIIYEVVDENNQIIKEVNKMMYFKYLDIIAFCEKLLMQKDKNAYKKYIIDRFKINETTTQNLEDIYNASTLQDYLDKILGKRLYNEEQQELSDLIIKQLISGTNKVDYRTKKLKPLTLENILRVQLELSYAVSKPKREDCIIDGKRISRSYIIISKIN